MPTALTLPSQHKRYSLLTTKTLPIHSRIRSTQTT